MRIKVGDTVKVIAGDDKGTTGKVIRVIVDKNRVVVEGVNKIQKHVKRSQKTPQGGRLSKEAPIHASNVMLVAANGETTRIGVRKTADGGKERFARNGGAALGLVAPPKKKAAAKK
ncbi:MAG: 50S ribosomal protein L24 [Pirellulales bacterium]